MSETAPSGDTPFLRLPDPCTHFRQRAERLRELASGRPALADYLRFIARVAVAQQEAVLALPVSAAANVITAAPSAQTRSLTRRSVFSSRWRSALEVIAESCRNCGAEIGNLICVIERASAEDCAAWATALRIGNYTHLPRGLTVLVAAALQVEWTMLAAQVGSALPLATEHRNECPVCGSLPVVSVIAAGGDVRGLRYLCCSLCATQWHLPRIRCVHCNSTEGIAYYAIEGWNRAVRAETCARCKTYSKILDLEKDPGLEPFADDLASLPLDILLADAHFQRFGMNPFLVPGE